jgi:hypothetical protein
MNPINIFGNPQQFLKQMIKKHRNKNLQALSVRNTKESKGLSEL